LKSKQNIKNVESSKILMEKANIELKKLQILLFRTFQNGGQKPKDINLQDQSFEPFDNKNKTQTKLDLLKNPYQHTMKSLSTYKDDNNKLH
jgi:hypothetical protein